MGQTDRAAPHRAAEWDGVAARAAEAGGIDVVDDLTQNINTNTPPIGLPPSLSRAVAPEGTIVPTDYIEKVSEEVFRRKPIGSGPRGTSCCRLAEWRACSGLGRKVIALRRRG